MGGRYRLTDAQRQLILARSKVPLADAALFVPLLELDMQSLADAERAGGDGRFDARRRFAVSVAASLDGLGVSFGRGRSGPLFNTLAVCFRVLEIRLADVKPYADYAVAAALLPDDRQAHRLTMTAAERSAAREEAAARRARSTRNRQLRRKLTKAKRLK